MTTLSYAILGAVVGLLGVLAGFGVHIGQLYLAGIEADIVAILGGAGAALIVRFAIRTQFGPIIP